jgi:protein TonB
VLANPKPDYPRQARRRGLEGQVVLEVEVRADGRPGRIDIVASSGHAILDRAALEGLRRWRFQPARHGGRAVDATLRVPVSFRLN